MKRILVIGGYGNFGSVIVRALAKDTNIQVIIGGRSHKKAAAFIKDMKDASSSEGFIHEPESAVFDIHQNFNTALITIRPHIVIHTSGPFQGQSYDIAKACIDYGCHYIDLADARDFVSGIVALDDASRARDVLVVSGASSVPCLTSSIIDHFKPEFKTLESLDYGITTAQKTNRGLATTAAILGYTGKPFKTLIDGELEEIHGWQNLHRRYYKAIGYRFLGNCDVPDLSLFPDRYQDLKTIRFYAGLEIPFLHIILWLLSWGVRIGIIRNLQSAAAIMLKVSYLFDIFGSDISAFHMEMRGVNHYEQKQCFTFELIARSGHGPNIPCIPAILLAKALSCPENFLKKRGAMACVGLISFQDYMLALEDFDIEWDLM